MGGPENEPVFCHVSQAREYDKKRQTWSILWLQRHVTHVSIVSIFGIHGQYFFLHYASIYYVHMIAYVPYIIPTTGVKQSKKLKIMGYLYLF